MASDAVGGIRTVAAFCAEDKVEAYHLRCRAPARQGLRQGVATGLGFGFSSLVLYCAYALIFYAGARFVQDGKATFAQVFRVSHAGEPGGRPAAPPESHYRVGQLTAELSSAGLLRAGHDGDRGVKDQRAGPGH